MKDIVRWSLECVQDMVENRKNSVGKNKILNNYLKIIFQINKKRIIWLRFYDR